MGWVWDPYDQQWINDGVYKRSEIQSKQYWEPIIPSFNYKRERLKEEQHQEHNPEFIDERLQAYRDEMWARRDRGMWFMNNGVPTYITGQHFFYMNFWVIDVGLPSYRDADRKYFLFWWYCQVDPNCYGMIEMTRRRAGKSYRAACVMYEVISRNFEFHGGIQSKTGPDAKKFYNKIIKSFKKLPDFFIPEYDKDGVKSGLYFQKTLRRGQRIEQEEEDYLDSDITFESANNLAYDGSKLQIYIRDEAGKIDRADPEANVFSGWRIVKPCLMSGTKTIIGKAIFTSTVEEGGSEPFKKLWEGSDPSKRNDNGRTKTGMYRFFIPTYENDEDFMDKYGICDKDASMEFQVNERNSRRDDPRELASYIRLYPWKPEEAFHRDGDKSPYNVLLLNEVLEYLTWDDEAKDLVVRGDLLWKDGIRDEMVIFVENPRGKFLMNRIINPFDYESWNNVDLSGPRLRPMNENSIVVGVDPFDHKTIDIGYTTTMSKGAGYVFHKYDGLNESLSEKFLCEYIERPSDPNTFFEDMIKMCFFFGAKVLVERNRSGIVNYFDTRGYSHWMKKEKGRKERGISAGIENKEQAAEVTATYILEHAKSVPFERLVRDWLDFDIDNSKKNDAAMAAGWALFAAYRIDRAFKKDRKAMPKRKAGVLKKTLRRL